MSDLHRTIPAELADALRVLVAENIGDNVYDIRERELKGWEGPRVTAFSNAVTVIEKYAAPPAPVVVPELTREEAIALIPEARRDEILRALQVPGGEG